MLRPYVARFPPSRAAFDSACAARISSSRDSRGLTEVAVVVPPFGDVLVVKAREGGDVHVAPCTPFVIALIGRSGNMRRETWAWRMETPFALRQKNIASAVRLNTPPSGWVSRSRMPVRSLPRTLSTSSDEKRSCPASTGVCVVNTHFWRTSSTSDSVTAPRAFRLARVLGAERE